MAERTNTALCDRLEQLGYFRYTPPHRLAQVKHGFIRKPSLFNVWIRRDYPADEERLVEKGVSGFLRDIRYVLRAHGINLGTIDEECGRSGYWISISGNRYEMYNESELYAANHHKSTLIWEQTTQRTFTLVNDFLAGVGSDERLYSYAGWNDHWAFFFTNAQRDVLLGSALGDVVQKCVLYLEA